MEHIGTFGASSYQIGDLQLFRDSDGSDVAALLAPCAIIRLQAGQAITDTQQACVYIVLRGVLTVAADTHTGMNDGTVSKVLPGESVGEQSVLDEESNLSAISALQESDLLVIKAETVWQLIDGSNVLARNLLRLLSFRIRAANALLRRRQKLGEFYRQLSMVDGLTSLYNRAWLNDLLPTMIATAHASQTPLSLIMIDLDHFKRFNDTHGHVAGDNALRSAAQVLSAALRPTDFAVRYGGEEMMVILPDTNEKVALAVSERLCERIQQSVIFSDMRCPLPHITGSFGIATLHEGQDEHSLIAAADAALYRAKAAGRNTISL
ncbi:GGDEF domain-containing protein [Janthinobacterium agaricidamnosum]|uniref:diguanylate cyclase n=1 Tax=Janthinobacterium agaricidamnosum NBRC 102515 = DSM 9628 TaxID=1349767 RepID=W0VBZ6_9BURK|nr:diguanylate cyclase [Janthinobacterium agaricidamnosum]CDG84827.1 diguanylate cyclase domain protein [Janthinobacterium agaricidamnosum NBRC 102515 = DSM 9628]